MAPTSDLVTARLRRRVPVLVCGKCLKRAANGKELRRALKVALKPRHDDDTKHKPRLLKTSCLGICPKRAIVIASGATLARGECLMLAREADADAAAAMLLPPPTS